VKNPLTHATRTDPPSVATPEEEPPLNASTAFAGNGHSSVSVFEPPRSLLVDAIQFHKLLICVLAALGALIGGAIGLARDPIYTASATLQVGEVNPNSPGFGSYTQSATSLATGFSRAIGAEPVLAEIQRKLGVGPKTAVSRLSAEPIPLSPVFRVIATGPSESSAVRLANVTGAAVVSYISKSNSATPQSKELLGAYRQAALELKRASSKQQSLEGEGSAPTEAPLRAEAATSTAQVKLEAISRSYIAAVTSQAPRAGLVTVLAGATTASGDRQSKLELYAFIGLLIGLLIGCLAALWRERRLSRLASSTNALASRPR
jgi:uncharacterized protein involved in exopolysaccharide biosynthesis